MKLAFGLASLVTACAAQPRHPLCNGDGSPACGNIGQVGRDHGGALHRPPADLRPSQTVVGASAEVTRASAQPDRELSFVVTRRAPRRPSRDAAVDATSQPAHARLIASPHRPLLATFAIHELALQTQRPRFAAGDDVAVGNVMGKGGFKHRVARHELLSAPAQPTLEAQRPRVTDDDDFAVGNMAVKK